MYRLSAPLFILLSCLILSCKKSSNSVSQEIVGTWEYKTYSGYPFTQSVYPPGNGNLLVINKDGSFERKKHDSLYSSGSYQLSSKKDCLPREENTRITLNEQGQAEDYYISFHDGDLWLGSPNCFQDAGYGIWRRVQSQQ